MTSNTPHDLADILATFQGISLSSDCGLPSMAWPKAESGLEEDELSEEQMVAESCEKLDLVLTDEKEFDHGGFAKVYKVTSRVSKEEFALKISRPQDKTDGEREARYLRSEVRIQQSLNHKGIVKVFGSYLGRGFVAIQMELCRMNLREYTRGRMKSLEESVSDEVARLKILEGELRPFLRDVLRGLVYLHDNGIMHRDIQPRNILIAKNEYNAYAAKLADFGLAKNKHTKDLHS